jgi:ABC-type transporter Mla MlaB component
MASKGARASLLSKVAKFVRNPTKDWSELYSTDSQPGSTPDMLALKAIIERKRQNDFVRGREFDHLRKLRNRDPAATASRATPSLFQSSIVSGADSDDRAVTLKKIDEIEAHMSRQWWRAKLDATTARGDVPPPAPVRAFDTAPQALPAAFQPTEPIGLGMAMSLGLNHGSHQASEADGPAPQYAETGTGGDLLDLHFGHDIADRPPVQGVVTHISDAGELRFSTSDLFAMDMDDVETDPELEEAAIRFANGDDAGAESGLILALGNTGAHAALVPNWAAALLDVYRATRSRVKFDWALIEYARCWQGRLPLWDAAIYPEAAWGLHGSLTGDAAEYLAAIDAAHKAAPTIVVPCRHLVRVDFAAAGSILNWVAERQSEGRMVQFEGVSRLVATFFNVIGIHHHARVILRPL